MATIAIRLDNDGTGPNDEPMQETPTNAAARWIARGSAFLKAFGGGGVPTSVAGKCWSVIARMWMLCCPILYFYQRTVLWPCGGLECPEEGSFKTEYAIAPPLLLGAVATISLTSRLVDKQNMDLLKRERATMSRNTFSTKYLPAIRAIIAVILVISAVGGQIKSGKNTLSSVSVSYDVANDVANDAANDGSCTSCATRY